MTETEAPEIVEDDEGTGAVPVDPDDETEEPDQTEEEVPA